MASNATPMDPGITIKEEVVMEDASSGESAKKVVELLNSAQTELGEDRIDKLKIVQEIIVHKEPDLLDNFVDEVLAFQVDRSQEIRKFVVGFIEEACKKDPELLPKVIANLHMMIEDQSVVIIKRVIQAATHLYKSTLKFLSQAKNISDDMGAAWNLLVEIKEIIVGLLDSDNDGVRTITVKFMEMVVLTQTHREASSAVKGGDFCLDDIPLGLKFARPRKLEEDARRVFGKLVEYHGSPHISSANLMTCMGSLTNIAKLRPKFMSQVITALEMLQANLPPTLARSQVSSVRKHLKNQLLALLKHQTAAENFFSNITTLLTDLGASREEVMKAMPNYEEMKRRARKKEREAARMAAALRAEEAVAEEEAMAAASKEDEENEDGGSRVRDGVKTLAGGAKRQEIDTADDEDDSEDEDEPSESTGVEGEVFRAESAIDITEKFIFERLVDPRVASDMVMQFMNELPAAMPPQFNNTYTPLAAAGTNPQIRHVSRLLAAQLTSEGLGPGVLAEKELKRAQLQEEAEDDDMGKISVVGDSGAAIQSGTLAVKLTPAGLSARKGRKAAALKLSEITKPLSVSTRKLMVVDAIQRILKCEHAASIGGVAEMRNKIITSLAASFSSDIRNILLDFIFEDPVNRADLAFSWLFEEYCYYQDFHRNSSFLKRNTQDCSSYNEILCSLIKGINYRSNLTQTDRNQIMRRLYLESPIITDDASLLLKQFCQGPGLALIGVNLMKDLVTRRPTKQLNFLNHILEFCGHEEEEVRETAINTIISLHDNGELATLIQDYGVMYLRFLLLPRPPDILFGEDRGRPVHPERPPSWSDELIRVCLHLYMALLPKNQKLLGILAEVYTNTSGDIKRTILRILDSPIRAIGMESPELLSLVETCPKGSETLITRIVHILTEKVPPSRQLVERVKDLYAQRVADVRFLIPVLPGLSKSEILTALPKLIQLNPVVVKEVFNRLLGSSGAAGTKAPMTPSDLLIALHNVDSAKCDMKTVIKATSICFQDRSVFTMEVLTIVLQQLMEQKEIPLLLMRTVIQTVTLYPHIIGFTMNILQRLIVKQVWKQKMLWEGFIKCCQRTTPQSFTVLLQLPPPQLRLLLHTAADLRDPILVHVQGFTEAQRQHIPSSIMEVLYTSDDPLEMHQIRPEQPPQQVVPETTVE